MIRITVMTARCLLQFLTRPFLRLENFAHIVDLQWQRLGVCSVVLKSAIGSDRLRVVFKYTIVGQLRYTASVLEVRLRQSVGHRSKSDILHANK